MKSMSVTSLRGSIADANTAIEGQKSAIADLTGEIDSLIAKRDEYVSKGKQFGTTAEQGNGLLKIAARLTDEINQKQRDRSDIEGKLNDTIRTRDSAQTILNNNMLESMGIHDSLIEKGTVLEQVQDAVAKAFGNTANAINRANQAGQNFNPKALEISPPTQAGDKIILNLEEQNELLKIQDERLRAVTKAGMEAAKATENPNQIAAAKRLAGENYDLQKAEEARNKAASEAESQGKKSASQAESITQKLSSLKQQSELAADSTKELSREQAILTAQQSLGKGATEGQIRLAGQYAAKTWDVANALKMRQQAEQAGRFVNQEVAAGKTSVDPVTGAVQDPTAQIALEEQQKLQALQSYQDQGVLSVQQYEDAKTAIQLQASNARKAIAQTEANQQVQALGSILSSASSGFDSLASMIENAGGKSSGAYLAMFAASKAFAIAQSTLSLNMAIMQAMADPTALTPYQKLANYAAIASAGASLLSNVASVTLSGAREHGGPVNANSMYRVGEGGKPEIYQANNGSQYMIPGDNGRVISNRDMRSGGGGGDVTIHQENHYHFDGSPNSPETVKQFDKVAYNAALRAIRNEQRPNGMLEKAVNVHISDGQIKRRMRWITISKILQHLIMTMVPGLSQGSFFIMKRI